MPMTPIKPKMGMTTASTMTRKLISVTFVIWISQRFYLIFDPISDLNKLTDENKIRALYMRERRGREAQSHNGEENSNWKMELEYQDIRDIVKGLSRDLVTVCMCIAHCAMRVKSRFKILFCIVL